MATSGKLSSSGEVGALFTELMTSFEKERWSDVLDSLKRVAEVGEKNGKRELSIQAQSLSASITTRTKRSDATPFRELTDQYEMLMTNLKDQLSHLIWTKEVSVLPKIG